MIDSLTLNNRNPLPPMWIRLKLGEICERITKGSTPTSYGYSYKTEGINFIRAENIDDETNQFLRRSILKENDLLFSIAGTIGRVGIIRKTDLPANTNQALAIIRTSQGTINTKFLFYFLKSEEIQKHALKAIVGVGRANLSLTNIGELEIVIAPQNEQKHIVEEIEKQFSRLDEAVAALKRIKANLKRYKASVLKAAVEGKLTEKWRKTHPDVELASELLKRILNERRRKWEDANQRKKYKEPIKPDLTNLIEIPEGWIWVNLEMITEAIGGYAFKSKEFTNNGHQIVKMANIKMEKLDLTQHPSFMSNVPDEIVEKYSLIDGDIIITLTGTRKKRDYGYVVQIKEHKTSLLLNQRIARLRPYLQEVSTYLSIVLQSEVYRNRFFSYETGNVGQGNVSMKAVTIEPIPLPPLEEQITIIREYERGVSVANNVEREVETNLKRTERLRQSILRKAFSGKLVKQDQDDKPTNKLIDAIKLEKDKVL